MTPEESLASWVLYVISLISGAKFIQMIKVVFTNIQSKIKANGFLFDPFTLMRGCVSTLNAAIHYCS